MKLITNMGSANPQAAARKCVEIARRHGLTGMKIACVTGDDLLPVLDKYMDTEVGRPTMSPCPSCPARRLRQRLHGRGGDPEGAEEGRRRGHHRTVADPAIFMAPAIHAFGWSLEDWDKLGQRAP